MIREINTTMCYDNTIDYLIDQAIEEMDREEKDND